MSYPVRTGRDSVSFFRFPAGMFLCIIAAVLLFFPANLYAQESLSNRELKYEKIIETSAAKHGVDPMLVKAIIFTESSFCPQKVGKDGEIGLMQIRHAAAADWAESKGVKQPTPEEMYQPELNIEIGTWYITRALRRWYKNPDFLRMALAEYNAGRSRLLEWMALYNDDTDMVMAHKPVGRYAEKVCRKYVEYVILNEKLKIPKEPGKKIAQKD